MVLLFIIDPHSKDSGIHQVVDVFIYRFNDLINRKGRSYGSSDFAELFGICPAFVFGFGSKFRLS